MDNQTRFRPTPQLILGLIVLAAGVLFLLDNMNILTAFDYLRFWPLGIIAFGLTIVFESNRTPGHIGGLILIGIGSLLLLNNLNVIHFRFRHFLPVILVIIGASLIWQVFARERNTPPRAYDASSGMAFLGGIKKTLTMQDFRGGEYTAIMGGCELDFRSAEMQVEEAVISVFVVWGGIEMKVPENWIVVNQVTPVLGGCGDSSQAPRNGTPKRLIIRGLVVMGGVEIRN